MVKKLTENNKRIILVLSILAISILLISFYGKYLSISSFTGTIDRSDLISLKTPNVNYGDNITFSIRTPPKLEIALSKPGDIMYGFNYVTYGIASVVYDNPQVVMSIDGQQIQSYQPVSGIGCSQYGGYIEGGYDYTTRKACIISGSSPVFTYDPRAQNISVVNTNAFQTNTDLAVFSFPQYLSPGNHELQIYWIGAPGAVDLEMSRFDMVNQYNCGGITCYANDKLFAKINFTVSDINMSVSCDGTNQNGTCYVRQNYCSPGETRYADLCIHSNYYSKVEQPLPTIIQNITVINTTTIVQNTTTINLPQNKSNVDYTQYIIIIILAVMVIGIYLISGKKKLF